MDHSEEVCCSPKNRALYMSSWYHDKAKPANPSSFSWTAKLHIEKILDNKTNSVYDIGCGAAGILLALQKRNVKKIYGIDASSDAIELARKRFSKFGTLNDVSLSVGDALNADSPRVDAVSLHRVVCCYPDAIGLVSKAVETKPKILVLTFPRSRWDTKILSLIENIVLRTIAIFKPSIRGMGSYIHDPETIEERLKEIGYAQNFKKIGFYWQTVVYQLNPQGD